MSKSRGSSPTPRKFSEKIALLNKKEAEATAEFEKILKEVEETTRVSPQSQQYWCPPTRSASFSNRLACDQQLRPHPHPDPNHYAQQSPGQYYTQPLQFQSPSNQMHQQRQQVVSDIRQQQQQLHNQQHQQQQQPQHQQQHQPQQPQRQQPTIYVNHPQNNYVHQSIASCNTMQPISIEVPNIEIFPIDDEYQHQNVHAPTSNPTTGSPDTLTNGHCSNDCSNSSISSARSLPNIATLCVSPSSSSTNHMMAQPITSQRLIPPMSNNHLGATTTTTTTTMMSNTNNDNYMLESNTEWYNNEDTCSLPIIQDPMPSISRHDQNRQSQTHIHQMNSWQQQVAVSSAPSSAAPTPPFGNMVQASPYGEQQQSPQQQTIHSADSSPHRQQHSPQSLQQDYYPPQSVQTQAPIIRASSTNLINKYPANDNLLEAPQINNNLSKSTDACYGYRDEFISNEIFCSQLGDSGGGQNYVNNNSGIQHVTTPNNISRSCSDKNIDFNPQSQNLW